MNIILVALGLSIVVLLGAAAVFFWVIDHRQFDDIETSGLLALEEQPAREPSDDESLNE